MKPFLFLYFSVLLWSTETGFRSSLPVSAAVLPAMTSVLHTWVSTSLPGSSVPEMESRTLVWPLGVLEIYKAHKPYFPSILPTPKDLFFGLFESLNQQSSQINWTLLGLDRNQLHLYRPKTAFVSGSSLVWESFPLTDGNQLFAATTLIFDYPVYLISRHSSSLSTKALEDALNPLIQWPEAKGKP